MLLRESVRNGSYQVCKKFLYKKAGKFNLTGIVNVWEKAEKTGGE
jgi:hypothetical protein